MTDRHKQEQHRGGKASWARGGPRPVVDRVRDGRVDPVCGLPADADPVQPVPQQARQAGPVPAGVHDRLGRHLGRHRVVPQRGWAAGRAVLLGFRGGCLFPWCVSAPLPSCFIFASAMTNCLILFCCDQDVSTTCHAGTPGRSWALGHLSSTAGLSSQAPSRG